MRRTLLGAAVLACVTMPAAAQNPPSDYWAGIARQHATEQAVALGQLYANCVAYGSAALGAMTDVPLADIPLVAGVSCRDQREALEFISPGASGRLDRDAELRRLWLEGAARRRAEDPFGRLATVARRRGT